MSKEIPQSQPHKQYNVVLQPFDAYNKELPIQEATGSQRGRKILEASEIRSVNWNPGVSGWRLTRRGLEFGNTSGVFPAGSISFSSLQDIATSKILGRKTAGTGIIEQLSASDVKTILALVSSDITGFAESVEDVIGGILADSATIDFVYTDGTDSITAHVIKVIPRPISMADATSFTPTADTADMNFHVNTQIVGTLTANAPSGTPTDGQKICIRIKSTNVQTFAWDAVYRGNTTIPLPTASTGGGKTDYFHFQYNLADSKWDLQIANYGA